MSKNRNRAKLNKAKDSREYTMIMKNQYLYCYICVRKTGRFGATCGPVRWSVGWRAGYKNPRKAIATWQARGFRTWKHNRDTRWKN